MRQRLERENKKKVGERNIEKITELNFATEDAALPPTASRLQL